MAPKAKKEEKWVKSAAKEHLLNLLKVDKIPSEMTPKEVFERFCAPKTELNFGEKRLFSGRLRSLRNKVAEKNVIAARDAAAFAKDQVIYPRLHQDGYGLPHWPDSDAKAFLCKDIDQGLHLSLSMGALWSSRPEHTEHFPFSTFVKHVHQEVKTRKFHQCCKDKADKKISQKALANIPSNTR